MKERLYLPALRGVFGEWIYYSCLISAQDLADRVALVADIHQNKKLSEMIQRNIVKGRSQAIAQYLVSEKQKFIGSLVLAVYGGEPEWLEASIVSNKEGFSTDNISESAQHSVGFLYLNGEEKIFAIDGQHRIAGFKDALENKTDLTGLEVNVLMVGHSKDQAGLEKTRRLFTTLNKRAVKVSKGEIISLDEDDLRAIIVRKLVEENQNFLGDRIIFSHTNNVTKSHTKSLTTIGNLYDLVGTVLVKLRNISKSDLENSPRPDETIVEQHYKFVSDFFAKMIGAFEPLAEFFTDQGETAAVRTYRGDFGGNILFRPVGLQIVIDLICELSEKSSLPTALKQIQAIPLELNSPPFEDVIWNSTRMSMQLRGKTVARDMLRIELGLIQDQKKIQAINKKYQDFIR